MSYQIAYDVRNTRASTWRGTFNSAHSLPPPASTSDNGESAPQLTRKRSIGPVWCDHDRKVSALLNAGLQRPAPEPRRRQNEAIPIPESLDANGLHRSQAWDFQASPDVREDRVKMRLAKVQQYTQEHLLDCKIAGMGPCQAGWRMGYEHTGDCPRPALPDGAFCAIHTCTANGRDNERCLNHVPDPFKLSNQGLPRICRSGYHVENNQANKLDHAIALNAAILAKEAEEAPQRELEHLQRYAEITGETEAADGYSIYTQLNGTIRRKSDGGLKPSALDLTAASRRPSFSEPTPLWTSRSSSAESSRLRTPTTPLPAKEWPLYTLDAALLKVQLDTACSVVKRDTITAAPLTDSPAMLEPSPVLRQAPVIPAKKNVAGLSIEVISVTGHGVDSPISPSPSNIQLRRGSLSPIAAKPALPTVEECEEGHATPQRSSAATSPAAAPITITRSRLALSSSPLTAAHLTVGDARSNTSAYLSTSPCSAISQLQIVLGQAKRTPATSVSIDRTSFTSTAASASSQYLTAASTSSQQASMTSSTSSDVEGEVEVVMPRLSVATGDDVLTVKERVAARKAADGRSSNMARIMRGRMGDGFMHRSAWGRTQQMDEDLLAIQAE